MNNNPLIASWIEIFTSQKKLAEHAFSQLTDAQLHERITPNINPVATLIKHLAGNLRSRWTDFLTTDGEKPDRDRDSEFIDDLDHESLMAAWESGWAILFETLAALPEDFMSRTVTIRSETHTVPQAVNRQISHFGYHIGQIHTISRSLLGDEKWSWASIEPGKTKIFNQMMQNHANK